MNFARSISFDQGVFVPAPPPAAGTVFSWSVMIVCVVATIATILVLDRFGVSLQPDGTLGTVLP
ncbi:MAG: hypothetical protein M3N26_10035 [Pseudomonadota bacterium]|nr:hypothetical protein [Pseudomonadota bacterium]